MSNNYEQMLELAKKERILTNEEFAGYGGSYYAEEMGLWIGQDADGGGIIPYAFQMVQVEEAGDEDTVSRLFADLGRQADIDAYAEELVELQKQRASFGYRD